MKIVTKPAARKRDPMVGCAGERRELQGKMLQTMKAKEIPFRRLATETGLAPFRIVAALLGQGTLPKNVAAKVATLLELPELEDFLSKAP